MNSNTNRKKKFRFPGILLIAIGAAVLFIGLKHFIPAWAAQTMSDLMPQVAEEVEGTCTYVQYNDDNTVSIKAEYPYGNFIYETEFTDVTLGSDRDKISEGDKISLYIFEDGIFFYDAINNNVENAKRSGTMFRSGAAMFLSVVLIIAGIVIMIINSKAKKKEQLEAQNAYYGYQGMNMPYSPPPQPTGTFEQVTPPPSVGAAPPPPPVYPPVQQPAPSPQPVNQSAQPSQADAVTPSEDGYTSLDFSHLPPSRPMTINDEPVEVPKTIEEDDPPDDEQENGGKPVFGSESEEPSQPEPQPAAPAPETVSEPVPLESIIKRGSDDAFNMRAEDYEADAALEALIKKGADDPFNMKPEDYKTDPALEALIRKGSDDPFMEGLKKEKDSEEHE